MVVCIACDDAGTVWKCAAHLHCNALIWYNNKDSRIHSCHAKQCCTLSCSGRGNEQHPLHVFIIQECIDSIHGNFILSHEPVDMSF